MKLKIAFCLWLTVCGLLAPAVAAVKAGMLAYANGDYKKALAELTLAAQSGNTLAQFTIGFMYANGKGVAKNDAEALRWYRMAAEKGQADAQYAVGFMYATGRGVVQPDPVEAAKWYRKAAGQGHTGAQYNLALAYSEGHGVPQDDEAAANWFRRAAENQHTGAAYRLGLAYAGGKGVPHDDVEAVKASRHKEGRGIDAIGEAEGRYAILISLQRGEQNAEQDGDDEALHCAALITLRSSWCAQVTVQPESNRITVLSSGTPRGSKTSIPTGGHWKPVASVGYSEALKKAQKNAAKNITSEAINSAMPYRMPSCTMGV